MKNKDIKKVYQCFTAATIYLGVIMSFSVNAEEIAGKGTDAAMNGQARPLLSRHDLKTLSTYDRKQVFAVLGSFDDRGLSEDEFVLQASELMSPDRVPGLVKARASKDVQAILRVIYTACRDKQHKSSASVAAAVITKADAVLENRFTFYGETHQLGESIDWEKNPGTAHWSHDLNRFTYIRTLTRAYCATADKRYSRKAVDLILDWIAKCDVGACFKGTRYMWGSYLNNAIHCKIWCTSLGSLIAADQVTPIEMLRILKSIHDQLAYLEILTNKHHGNWPTIGCDGILSCLGTFPVFRDTNRFVNYCMATLNTQIANQVLPDGVQNELTPHYHRVVIKELLSAIRSLRKIGGYKLAPKTMAILRKMVHYSQQSTVPDGSKQVAFNDSDPGSPGKLSASLKRLDLAAAFSPPEKLGPEVFPYAGVAFLRQRQDQGDLYMAFDAGPFGSSHQHEDKLGFWLFAYGRNFLVDPGRHLYDSSAASFRPYLMSTKAHSTIRIDGQEQHSRGRRDTWITKKPMTLGWQSSNTEVRANGVYDLGYGPDNAINVVHRREVVFVKQRFWVVFDVVEGKGEHLIESRFQFAPGNVVLKGTTARTTFSDANLLLRVMGDVTFDDVHIEKGQESPRGGWYSDSYGKIEPAPALSLSVRTNLPWRAATLLFPYRGKTAPKVSFAFKKGVAEIKCPDIGKVSIKCSLR